MAGLARPAAGSPRTSRFLAPGSFAAALAVTLAVSLATGCLPGFGPGSPPSQSIGLPGAAQVTDGERRIVGNVKAPAGAAAAVNAASRTQTYPATRRIASSEAGISGEVALPGAIVYLIDQDETLYSRDGKVVFALTDAQGRFTFSGVPDAPLLVVAVLPGNRRLAGLVRPKAGENAIEIGVATTYVAAYLRDRARVAGKTLDGLAGGRQLGPYLERLSTLTRDRIAAGGLPANPDLAVDAAPNLARMYGVVVASRDKGLAEAWADLLGHAVPAVETLAVPSLPAGEVRAVAAGATGDIYVGEIGDLVARISVLTPGGTPSGTSSGTSGGPLGGSPRVFLSGSRVSRQLGLPAVLAFDAGGSLFLGDGFTGLVRRFKPGTVRSTDIDLVPIETEWTTSAGEIPAIPSKSFRDLHPAALDISPRGVAFAPDGVVYVADARNHRIVSIAPTGEARRVAGLPPQGYDSNALAGFSGDGGLSAQAALAAPNGVAWRSEGTAGALYVADTDNHRIRRVDLATGIITTVAGSGPGFSRNAPPPGDFGGDGGLATAARLKYPNRVAFLPDGTMLVADTGNQRIREIGADAGIRTLAGGDPAAPGATATDGPADETVLGEVYDLAIDASGDVLIAAHERGLRKLWLRFGR